MKFYKVKPAFDQTSTKESILVANELYTERERNEMPEIPNEAFECVEIPESRVYWCFGARFELQNTTGGI